MLGECRVMDLQKQSLHYKYDLGSTEEQGYRVWHKGRMQPHWVPKNDENSATVEIPRVSLRLRIISKGRRNTINI